MRLGNAVFSDELIMDITDVDGLAEAFVQLYATYISDYADMTTMMPFDHFVQLIHAEGKRLRVEDGI